MKLKLNYITTIILLSSSTVYAQRINIDKFGYRDYLDFGQNIGAFSPQNNGFTVTSAKGGTVQLPNMPNFNYKNKSGNSTALGRGYVTTAHHVANNAWNATSQIKNGTSTSNQWGDSTYIFQMKNNQSGTIESRKGYGRDTEFLRTNKYIIEGHIGVSDVQGIGVDVGKQFADEDDSCRKGNTEACKAGSFSPKYFEIQQKLNDYYKKFDIMFQAGTGNLQFRQNGTAITKCPPPSTSNKVQCDMLSAGYNGVSGAIWQGYDPNRIGLIVGWNNTGFNGKPADHLGYHHANNAGFELKVETFGDFFSRIAEGDSGSSFVAFDKEKNEWVLLGVTSGQMAGGNPAMLSPVLKVDFDDYKKQWEKQITGQDTHNLEAEKDNIFSAGGTLTFDKAIDLKSGSLVFSKASDYTVKTNNNSQINSIAGLDIEKGVTVNWENIKWNDSLHKVGLGTLNIKNQTGGNIRFGEGEVVLSNDKAVEKAYMTGAMPR